MKTFSVFLCTRI